jgi:hypothetical protein
MMVSAVAQVTSSTIPAGSTADTGSVPASDGSAQAPKTNTTEDKYELQPGEDPQNRLVSPFVKHLAGDQKQFWTSPTRFRTRDLKWI